jgi:ketosteroid isomerase-like protein
VYTESANPSQPQYQPNAKKEAAMVDEKHKVAVHRLLEAFNAQDEAAFDDLATPEVAQQCKDAMHWAYATYEGHHIDATDMIADGDMVWVRVATQGGHSGEWEGIPATGKQWTNTGVLFFRFADNKIAEFDTLFDGLGHVKQLGATITPPASINT